MTWPTVAVLTVICTALTALVLFAGYDVDNGATAIVSLVTGFGLRGSQ